MYFAPFIVSAEHERKVPVVIERATAEDLKATAKDPKWQTDWTSEYLADEKIEKYSFENERRKLDCTRRVSGNGGAKCMCISYIWKVRPPATRH